ncbi:uncharacterized protein BP01DRAFT_2853 [Aspergillus saccharolyticus JOP 1030-1]|uniref:Uncharacterized protein n=1 Tax=Aspergillus saccharolyticus JOP 1030-1 TaxID=1450539 RepID=A0A318ZQ62_9EURO|nr:hypothetical protein BP01DRAFT_2853 [Aspergillus saccharolyticus JOP 1030-1]PYH49646.1 hypothetical protein BP01DRAFT_2853 [Aspergillus saccharolyticus JOP 1030-1]
MCSGRTRHSWGVTTENCHWHKIPAATTRRGSARDKILESHALTLLPINRTDQLQGREILLSGVFVSLAGWPIVLRSGQRISCFEGICFCTSSLAMRVEPLIAWVFLKDEADPLPMIFLDLPSHELLIKT